MSNIVVTASFPRGERVDALLGAAGLRVLLEAMGASVTVSEPPEEARRPRVDLRFLSPCPPGYDTVLGFLAKHDPVVLDLMDRDPEATKRDGFWLKHRARERGLEVIKVDACPWLRQTGIQTVNAYPVALLAERLSV